jgi:hypothetical protein
MHLNPGYFSQSFLLANCLWGGVASGYLIYGWRQRALIPFLGGVAMGAVSFFVVSALWMSLGSLAVMLAVWWLCKQGY